jgi:DNA-binding SARP family transcriptional activator
MADMSTLPTVELGVLGPLQVRQDGAPVAIPGAKPRAILSMLGLHNGSVVPADTLIKLLWGDYPPRTAAKALQTHISSLRRTLGDGVVVTEGAGWTLHGTEVDASRYKAAAKAGRDAAAAGDTTQAAARFEEALILWRGIPELPDGQRGQSEKTRWIESHAALVEDRADALLATGRAAEVIGDLEAAVAEAPLRERRWGQLMLALYRAGRQGEALGAYQRARSLLAEELGVDPGPELRRLENAIVAQDSSLDVAVAQQLPSVTRAVTFLLTDIEGSTAAWEADAGSMAIALARHDELVEQVVTSRGGRLIKTRGEGDATFSVFERPSGAASAAIELQDAITHEPWELREPMRIRVALHTGEVELRDGDYFGRAVNRAARLRSLAEGGQILCSGATAELVIDTLPDDVMLSDLGMRQLKNLARPEHVFELRLETADDSPAPQPSEPPMERPGLPAVLVGPGPFVGRGSELEGLLAAWQNALTGGLRTVLIAGEPGVGKTRLAGEWSQQAYEQGAVVLYGRCDEDLGAPYQPFAEALRALVPCIGANRLRALRGAEALLPLVPGLSDVLPDLAPPTRSDPDTERYALFDAVVALLEIASRGAPIVLVLDDLHWAAKPTLLLLRHLLRFGDHARVQIVGTYRSTDLDRSHPLAAMLADLHRDGTANRLNLSGLDEDDVTAYVAEAGYDDEDLAHALASVTGGNPFFLIEALRHVDESGGVWDQSTLPQGVREAVSRRLSRLPAETNKALAAAAVVGSRFAVELVESVVGEDLVDAFDEARQAGIVIEEPGGNYRFNHAIVRQSLLAELASVRRMRLHQRIATTLETLPGADDELLAELAHHYFECAWAGNAAKAVFYCRRAADQAMARLGYEGAADLYNQALHALEEIDEELPDRDEQVAELLVARCEALLAAGDAASAVSAVSQLQSATANSDRFAAWATCFDAQLSMLIHPERLDEAEAALGTAAAKLAGLDDAAGEAKAHTVRAGCLARLGRIANCEVALDNALTAARRAREHRRVNAVLAGAPLAALWGPNPVPRAGGRCLDVVRLLRITTDSPAVEATSTRCQAVLEAFRGRAAAARRMIDSARRTVTELGLRHALLEVEQFAGIVELVVGDTAAAEPYLRKAYNGFRRMGLDADTAETAALLGGACLALGREAEAEDLCTESESLAGHAQKPSMAWRTLRAQLLSRQGDHDEARRMAEAAVTLAERTDALVDHGDACLSLATVLGAAGDAAGARAAAERAATLYERKGAAALADKARNFLSERDVPPAPTPPEAPAVTLENECVRVGERVAAAIDRGAWDEFEQLFAPEVFFESRRKIVAFTKIDVPSSDWPQLNRRVVETGEVRANQMIITVRGEHLALARVRLATADESPGAPYDEFLQLYGIDPEGRIALQVWFDLEDIDAAMAELDVAYARFEKEQPRTRRLENTAARVFDNIWSHFAARDWIALANTTAENISHFDRRRVVNAGAQHGRDAVVSDLQVSADVGFTIFMLGAIAIRGERLVLARVRAAGRDAEVIQNDALNIVEIDTDGRIAEVVTFDLDDFDAAIAELDARYLAGDAAAHAETWSAVLRPYTAINRHELFATTPDWVNVDHRRGATFAPGDANAYVRASLDDGAGSIYVETVHRLTGPGAVVTYAAHETSPEGFDAEWRGIHVLTVDGDLISRFEVFDETDLEAALARFDELHPQTRRLENAASRVAGRSQEHFASRNWDAMTEMLAHDFSSDDRRRVVNAGVRRGRDAAVQDAHANANLGAKDITSTVIATRGQHLVLLSAQYSSSAQRPEAFHVDVLNIYEIDAGEMIAAIVTFDPDDFDAAIAELDARYLAGEAAAHAHAWSVITGGHAAVNRCELPPTTPDCASIDHRRGTAFAPGELIAYFRAGWDVGQEIRTYVEIVHRLSDLGAVCTHVGHGISHDGFDAEWRGVDLLTVEGELVNRCEVFDETDLEAAIARFDQLGRPPTRLENAASRVNARFIACVNARDWDASASLLADDHYGDDRRRVTGGGTRHGRDADIENMRVLADLGANITVEVIATRGDRLALTRNQVSFDQQQQGFLAEVLGIVETDLDGRIAAAIVLDFEDFEAAIAELDARYLASEAAAHAQTWSAMSGAFAAINRHELPERTPDFVNIDHRRAAAFAPGEMTAYLHQLLEDTPDINVYIEVVHRLNNLGAVVTAAAHGTSQQGFQAEWRESQILTFDGDLLTHCELFDGAELDAAIARFDQLIRPAPRLENAASRAIERMQACFMARDWNALADTLVDDIYNGDHRRVVNAGIQHGRDAAMENMRLAADLGITHATSSVIAIRGEHLALIRAQFSQDDEKSETFHVDVLQLVEIDADERIVAIKMFDADDFEPAIAELDGRYLAGEAAPYARTWSAITRAYATITGRELAATTPDWVNIDHRRVTAFAPGEANEYIRAAWELTPKLSIFVEAVHRLNNLGAVVAHAAQGSSREGFDAEWRATNLFTVDGDKINRCELFDAADLDVVIAKFEQLTAPAQRLENAASQVYDRLNALFASRDWDAMTEILAEDSSMDDRRRVVGAGVRRGRNATMAAWRAISEIAVTNIASVAIATRGTRLALCRTRAGTSGSEAFDVEALQIIDIDADERMVALVSFDINDIDAARTELDARYVAGEGAAYARTWSAIARSYAAFNRHELPTRDWVTVDHRRGTPFVSTNMTDALRNIWDLTPDLSIHIVQVHRLSDIGAVITHVRHGTSQEGFDAEWQAIDLLTVDGEIISGTEVFDETDLDAAVARFEELQPPPRRLENAASQVAEQFLAHFAARDWSGLAETLADEFSSDDRRRVVGAGLRHGRDAEMADLRSIADVGITNITSNPIATRGELLVLTRGRLTSRDQGAEAYFTESFSIVEINSDGRIIALVSFDLDDVDAAFEELDARYLAGEAAAHAHTWSVIAGAYAALNQGECPATTPDWVDIDHRGEVAFGPGDLIAYLRSGLDLDQGINIYIEAVHRLADFGGAITYAAHEISRDGFDAAWRGIALLTVEGDMVNRTEVFDEAELDAAIARFAELQPPTPQPDNAASRVAERYREHFAAGDWDAMAATLADDFSSDDRRRVVGAGVRHGRDDQIADMRAIAGLWLANMTSTNIATRGERLLLTRVGFLDRNQRREAFLTEVFDVIEINADARIVASVSFDLDDIDAAFAELDARYLAGAAANHARTWSVITDRYAAINRGELPTTPPNWADHRSLQRIKASDLTTNISVTWDLIQNLNFYIETVHRLSDLGAVTTRVVRGTSQEGLDAEWREVDLVTVEGGLVNRVEIFDEADLDAALARFEELQPQARRLENAASRASDHYLEHVVARDWDAIAEMLAEDYYTDDRRHLIGAGIYGREAEIASVQVQANLGLTHAMPTVIAVRGERLTLSRVRYSGRDQELETFYVEILVVFEINADDRFTAAVAFETDDLDAAFAELDARYLAGEAAPHARTWSIVVGAFAAVNRHQVPATAADWDIVDHRPLATSEAGDLALFLSAAWDLTPQASVHITAVHRLSDLGAVISHMSQATSQQGLDAEWQDINLTTVDGDLINRCEIFDEADLDTALTRFDQLNLQTRRLENAATAAEDRFHAYFAARDWAAIAEILTDTSFIDDRRPVINAGLWNGRADVIANMRALAEGGADITSAVLATRGERLAITRICSSNRELRYGEFGVEMLIVVEIDTDGRIAAHILFDPEDIVAAFEELDARYIAGEATAQAHTWSVITQVYAALNRHELPDATPDFVDIDHRHLAAIGPGDLMAYLRTALEEDSAQSSITIETVHRLTSLGAVVTHVAKGTSRGGFSAEWRITGIYTVEGDLINRYEIFEETDLDAALARFEELQPQAPRLENAASRVDDRFFAHWRARDWAAVAETLTEGSFVDDRRRTVNAGFWDGRDVLIANMRALAEVGANITLTVIATRGERLALTRICSPNRDLQHGEFGSEMLGVVEINTDDRITAHTVFDPENIDAAFEELDARYLAGEAAAHSHAWSFVAGIYSGFNRHQLPRTATDFAYVDRRPLVRVEASELPAFISALFDQTSDVSIYMEAVHRLSDLGVVVTHTARAISNEDFDAEWRMINIFTIDGNAVTRTETFDEADLDAALARFDEIHRPTRRLENDATRACASVVDAFNRRDMDGLLALGNANGRFEDRRKGLRDVAEGPGRWKVVHTMFQTVPSGWRLEVDPVAIRGSRLSLTRGRYRDVDDADQPIAVELLHVTELGEDGLIHATVNFDPEDVDAALAELDARYLAGEAAAHAHAWSAIMQAYVAINRGEIPTTTPDFVDIDRRPVAVLEAGDLRAYLRAAFNDTVGNRIYVEAVHRLTGLGAVVTHIARGISHEGFDAEWRITNVLTVDGNLINRCEMFDEADLDAALNRFDELEPK